MLGGLHAWRVLSPPMAREHMLRVCAIYGHLDCACCFENSAQVQFGLFARQTRLGSLRTSGVSLLRVCYLYEADDM